MYPQLPFPQRGGKPPQLLLVYREASPPRGWGALCPLPVAQGTAKPRGAGAGDTPGDTCTPQGPVLLSPLHQLALSVCTAFPPSPALMLVCAGLQQTGFSTFFSF